MSELREIVDTHYQGFNTKDIDLLLSVFDPDVETIAPGMNSKGVEAFRPFAEAFARAAPDGQIRGDRFFEDRDTIIVEGTFGGTNTGPLMTANGEIPATGRSFSFRFADIFEVRDGKCVSHRIYWDNAEFMAQLGMMPGGEG